MNPIKLNALDEYKQCAGNDCPNPGRILLEIRYIKKQGYFCTACSKDLLQNELAVTLKTSMKIGSSHDANERQRGQEKPLTKEESNMGQTFPDSRIRGEGSLIIFVLYVIRFAFAVSQQTNFHNLLICGSGYDLPYLVEDGSS